MSQDAGREKNVSGWAFFLAGVLVWLSLVNDDQSARIDALEQKVHALDAASVDPSGQQGDTK